MPDDPAATRQALEGKLAGAGLSEGARSAAVEWFTQRAGRAPAVEAPKHPYSLDDLDLDDGARPYLNAFLNHMAAGESPATQEEIAAALKVHRQLRGHVALKHAREAEEVDRLDREDAEKAQNALRVAWGDEYAPNLRLVDQYLRTLPADKRGQIEEERDDQGTLALNNPRRLKELAELARRGPVSVGATEAEEFAQLNKMLKDRASAYWRGPNAERNQARFRDLVRRGFQP